MACPESVVPAPFQDFENPDQVAAAASAWVARCDRGLTATEQDEYLQWLRKDPCHGRAIAGLEQGWRMLDTLAEWRPAHSAQPNPDLLARPRSVRLRHWRAAGFVFAAAAAVGVGLFLARLAQPVDTAAFAHVHVLPRPERLTLADGSVVELNGTGQIKIEFTPGERRVRLVRGEAHFSVAKNPARPFVVDAGAVSVRAVGTAFDVRRASTAVEVLVTEGKVHVERPATADAAAPPPTSLVAGERAVVDTTARSMPPVVTAVTTAEIERTLAWQGVRLEFSSLPLAEVVAEFNLRNPTQVVIGDPDTARLRVGGTFRADNVAGFVRLLETSFGVKTERRPDGTVVLGHAR
jgi:transmembrane sensor